MEATAAVFLSAAFSRAVQGITLFTVDKGNSGGENIHCGGILGVGGTFDSVDSRVSVGGGVSVGGRGTGYSEGTNSQSDNNEEGFREHFKRLERIEVKSVLIEKWDL